MQSKEATVKIASLEADTTSLKEALTFESKSMRENVAVLSQDIMVFNMYLFIF